MIDAEAGKVLVEYSRHIARWAKLSEQGKEVRTPRALKARENAWRMLSVFVDLAHNLAESDMYFMLAEIAEEQGKSPRERRRLYSVADAEGREYMKNKRALEALVVEIAHVEKNRVKAAAKKSVQPTKRTAPLKKAAKTIAAAKKVAVPVRHAPAKKAARLATRKKAV